MPPRNDILNCTLPLTLTPDVNESKQSCATKNSFRSNEVNCNHFQWTARRQQDGQTVGKKVIFRRRFECWCWYHAAVAASRVADSDGNKTTTLDVDVQLEVEVDRRLRATDIRYWQVGLLGHQTRAAPSMGTWSHVTLTFYCCGYTNGCIENLEQDIILRTDHGARQIVITLGNALGQL